MQPVFLCFFRIVDIWGNTVKSQNVVKNLEKGAVINKVFRFINVIYSVAVYLNKPVLAVPASVLHLCYINPSFSEIQSILLGFRPKYAVALK